MRYCRWGYFEPKGSLEHPNVKTLILTNTVFVDMTFWSPLEPLSHQVDILILIYETMQTNTLTNVSIMAPT